VLIKKMSYLFVIPDGQRVHTSYVYQSIDKELTLVSLDIVLGFNFLRIHSAT
jgi:hypothetical protein